eukprot:GFYU01021403.1.p1 GENE.GFYU01021403.1~~GFYU01021403.1.p1  ORF type:complete len:230 (-),score=51.00 GFYU01021403.1:29-718(-)
MKSVPSQSPELHNRRRSINAGVPVDHNRRLSANLGSPVASAQGPLVLTKDTHATHTAPGGKYLSPATALLTPPRVYDSPDGISFDISSEGSWHIVKLQGTGVEVNRHRMHVKHEAQVRNQDSGAGCSCKHCGPDLCRASGFPMTKQVKGHCTYCQGTGLRKRKFYGLLSCVSKKKNFMCFACRDGQIQVMACGSCASQCAKCTWECSFCLDAARVGGQKHKTIHEEPTL